MIKQRVVIETIRHADSLAETFNAADQDAKNHIRFCLPFIMVEQEDDVVEDGGDRVKALQAMQHHKICKSALMELMNVQHKWWGTCPKHLKQGSVPVHGLKGRPSNQKRRFRVEEEAQLITFFVEIKEFAEASATRFVLEETGKKSTGDDMELEYLPPSWSRLKLYQ